jgi:hypothetical protein
MIVLNDSIDYASQDDCIFPQISALRFTISVAANTLRVIIANLGQRDKCLNNISFCPGLRRKRNWRWDFPPPVESSGANICPSDFAGLPNSRNKPISCGGLIIQISFKLFCQDTFFINDSRHKYRNNKYGWD